MDNERKAAGKFVDLMLPESRAAPASAAAPGKPRPTAVCHSANDQAFLIHFDREVELLQDFTNSRDKLHKELDDMGPTSRSQDERAGTGDQRR